MTRRSALAGGLGGSGRFCQAARVCAGRPPDRERRDFQHVLGHGADLDAAFSALPAGRAAAGHGVLGPRDISPIFKANGTLSSRARPTTPGRRRSFADWRLADRRHGRTAAVAQRRPASRPSRAHPDHPPRLRRGLERHRPVDRRAARPAAEGGGAAAPGASYAVFHCADNLGGEPPRAAQAPASTTRASTWSTPSTPRPSSPTP